MGYSTDMLAHLASGKSIVGTANLVDDTGASNLPDGVKKVFKISKKYSSALQVLKSTDSGVTWTALALTTHYTVNTTANTITFVTAPLATDLIMVSNKTSTQSALQSDPQKVLQVQPKVYAANSHSVYKAAMMVYAATGKIPTGNS